MQLKVVNDYNGVVLWKGNSLLNGKPVVVIATGLSSKSNNVKTGSLVQVYILSDEGEQPTDALKNGKDSAICGDCIHRKVDGWNTCYVNVGQGPNAVYNAYIRGSYPSLNTSNFQKFYGKKLRLGAYGDPAAVPLTVWRLLVSVSSGWTGYTHQWRKCDPEMKQYFMASIETEEQLDLARQNGWKTFRVRGENEPILENEFVCPASKEADKRLTCEQCMACHGGEWNGKQFTPVIKVHGTHYKPKFFNEMKSCAL